MTGDGRALAAALVRAAHARSAITEVIAKVRCAELDLAAAFAIGDVDPLIGRCFAVKVFEVVPEIGKVRARRTMRDVGLAEDVWLNQVSEPQRRQVIAAFVSAANE